VLLRRLFKVGEVATSPTLIAKVEHEQVNLREFLKTFSKTQHLNRLVFYIFVPQNVSIMQQTLRNLIAEGKTAKVLAELRRLTASDTDLNNEVNLMASRFSEYDRQKRLGLEDPSVLNIELNKINNTLLSIVDRLPQAIPTKKRMTLIAMGILLTLALALVANWSTVALIISPTMVYHPGKLVVIRGLVKDTEGNVLPQVKITVEEKSVPSDDNGYFELTVNKHNDGTNYRINISKTGFETKNETYIPDSQIPEFRLHKK
jgi:Effector-associated domain 11